MTAEELSELHKKAYKKTKTIKLKRYGNENYNNINKLRKTRNSLTFEKYKTDIDDVIFLKYNNKFFKCECKICHNIFEIGQGNLYQRHYKYNKPSCPICFNNFSVKSAKELELHSFIKDNYNGTIIENDIQIIKPKELDVYLPDLKLAFEFDGTYWHADPRFYNENDIIKQKNLTAKEIWNYDELKINECKKIGINLIRISEYDWINNRNIIENKIKELLCQ